MCNITLTTEDFKRAEIEAVEAADAVLSEIENAAEKEALDIVGPDGSIEEYNTVYRWLFAYIYEARREAVFMKIINKICFGNKELCV